MGRIFKRSLKVLDENTNNLQQIEKEINSVRELINQNIGKILDQGSQVDSILSVIDVIQNNAEEFNINVVHIKEEAKRMNDLY